MTSLPGISLSGMANVGRYCQCLMPNTNNRIGNYIFSLFAPSKLINDPILDHFFLEVISRIPLIFPTNISYPYIFLPKYPVPDNPQ